MDSAKIISDYLHKNDWRVFENANARYSLSGLTLHISQEAISEYVLNNWYPKEVADAHREGYIHIHDLGVLTSYSYHKDTVIFIKKDDRIFCCSLEYLFNSIDQGRSDKDTTWYNIEKDDLYVLDKNNKWKKIKKICKHKRHNNILQFKAERGYFLEVTEDHPVITTSGIKLATKVKLGEKVTREYKLPLPSSRKTMGPEVAWLLGMIVSRGSKNTDTNYYTIYGKENYKWIASKFKKSGFSGTVKKIQTGVLVESEEFTQFVDVFNIQKYSKAKSLPASFLQYDDDTVYAMISGIIDAEGLYLDISNKYNSQFWISSSAYLINQIKLWLDGKGYKTLTFLKEYRVNDSISNAYTLVVYLQDAKQFNAFKESFVISSCKTNKFSKFNDIDFKKQELEINHISKKAVQDDYVYDITTESGTFYANGLLQHNCAGWSLMSLLLEGFGSKGKNLSKPPKHFDTATSLIVQYIGTLQLEWAGAQAFNSVDTLLAPFVRYDKLSYWEIKQQVQQLVYALNVSSRWGTQVPFSNITFDLTPPPDLRDLPVIIGGIPQKETYKEFQYEMDLINKAFLEVMLEGDAEGRVFTFPIPTYNLTENFKWDSEISDLLFEVTAKYGVPYFQNYISSGLKPASVRSMCCRLNLNLEELINRPGGMWSIGDNTGSIGVVTINLNRLGYKAQKKKKDFFPLLEHYLELAKTALEIRRQSVQQLYNMGLYPYTARYLKGYQNHFSTIGVVGMHDCCENLLGCSIKTPKGKDFTIRVLSQIRDIIREFQTETGNLYNLEATPAEGASYRLAKLDKQLCKNIYTSDEGDGEPFLTNSTQLHVKDTKNIFDVIEHQQEIQSLYTGGTVLHIFLGESPSVKTVKELVKKIAYKSRIPYFSITPTYSICPQHGYLKGEQPTCPNCGSETDVYSRIVGYYRPVASWNAGKRNEFKKRKNFEL